MPNPHHAAEIPQLKLQVEQLAQAMARMEQILMQTVQGRTGHHNNNGQQPGPQDPHEQGDAHMDMSGGQQQHPNNNSSKTEKGPPEDDAQSHFRPVGHDQHQGLCA